MGVTVTLFTVAMTWTSLRIAPTVEWIKKIMVHIYIQYSGILLRHKKEWSKVICSNMDGPRDCHTKQSKPKTNMIVNQVQEAQRVPYRINPRGNM